MSKILLVLLLVTQVYGEPVKFGRNELTLAMAQRGIKPNALRLELKLVPGKPESSKSEPGKTGSGKLGAKAGDTVSGLRVERITENSVTFREPVGGPRTVSLPELAPPAPTEPRR